MRRYYVLAIATSALMLMPSLTMALNLPGPIVQCTGAGGSHPCTCKDLVTSAQNLLYTGIYLAVFTSAILFAWAGWKMLTGRTVGNSGDIENAKKILWNVIIGLVIILAAWLIVNTLLTTLVNGSRGFNFCP